MASGQPFTFEIAPEELEEIPKLETSPFLDVLPDRGNFGVYRPGERIVLTLSSERDGYVSVFDYTPQGEAQILKNNEFFVAGSQKRISGTVVGPEGVERFLVVLTPRAIPDRILVEAMKRPTRIRALLGDEVHVQHCAIQITEERVLAPSFLQFDRVVQEVAPGARVKLRVFLGDEAGNGLANRRIQWEVSEGKLERYQTFTNTSGFSEVWYVAPSLAEEKEVTVRASFEGDMVYGASSQEIRFLVRAEKRMTVLEVSPAVFRVGAGEAMELEALLQDAQGNPIGGKVVHWTASVGTFEHVNTTTDSSGRAENRFFAPWTEARESVEIRVSFGGTARFLPSEGYARGTVSGMGVYFGEGFYFLDWSSGKVKTNFENLVYQGRVEKGFFENPVFALLLGEGEYLEASFVLSQPLQAGALCVWGAADAPGALRLYVNGQLSFAGKVEKGKGNPLRVHIVSLAPFLELGENAIRVEFVPDEVGAQYALQRVLVVF
ncbi:MAG: Ig-like domain-containing protein [Candidatus Caldatribacterium sp.]|nr:Ig-like domain-containing protein [Candidatus Caldatribacterium sp.]